MFKTSDPRHVHNHQIREPERVKQRFKVDSNAVSTRRQIEDIQERRRLRELFDL